MVVASNPYRSLQEHLDGMPVGYPATESGVEIELLKAVFTPEQARVAIHLDYKHKTVEQIYETADVEVGSEEQLREVLDEMVAHGAITRRNRAGKWQYAVLPLVLWGMFEPSSRCSHPPIWGTWASTCRTSSVAS